MTALRHLTSLVRRTSCAPRDGCQGQLPFAIPHPTEAHMSASEYAPVHGTSSGSRRSVWSPALFCSVARAAPVGVVGRAAGRTDVGKIPQVGRSPAESSFLGKSSCLREMDDVQKRRTRRLHQEWRVRGDRVRVRGCSPPADPWGPARCRTRPSALPRGYGSRCRRSR